MEDVNGRVCGALVQFGYVRLSLDVNMHMYMYMYVHIYMHM